MWGNLLGEDVFARFDTWYMCLTYKIVTSEPAVGVESEDLVTCVEALFDREALSFSTYRGAGGVDDLVFESCTARKHDKGKSDAERGD